MKSFSHQRRDVRLFLSSNSLLVPGITIQPAISFNQPNMPLNNGVVDAWVDQSVSVSQAWLVLQRAQRDDWLLRAISAAVMV
ncbi:hypothetical protein E3Z27_08295 [Pseudomonas mediterranea]|uniref:hypothetical protein n=1 Tax=Pseudomonas mediterranea TaxID=183795 RepID=UPI0013197ED0|nr:hypothetical protein [Pseudomonas mediterranea]QHA81687.1 hypothetical protein E3Z27_08295 [Pseudomonas mediterranea]